MEHFYLDLKHSRNEDLVCGLGSCFIYPGFRLSRARVWGVGPGHKVQRLESTAKCSRDLGHQCIKVLQTDPKPISLNPLKCVGSIGSRTLDLKRLVTVRVACNTQRVGSKVPT